MGNKIGIIIPAYKDTYMRDMLKSISLQDLSDCCIYIGDDNSPYDIKSIVDDFSGKMPIYYYRFEKNLGGKDLVAQWMRCVALDKQSEWIWLFSDDDIMCPDCIKHVKGAINKLGTKYDLYHVNGLIVDNNLKEIGKTPLFPEFIDSSEFITRLIQNKDNSWGINYIVHRTKFEKEGGFVNFDLAWNSDRASWMKFGTPNGIYTVPNAKILWRYSGENITALKKNVEVQRRKAFARAAFLKWLALFKKDNKIKTKMHVLDKVYYLLRSFKTDICIGMKDALRVFFTSAKYIFK